MRCVLENRHGRIWVHNFLGNQKKEYSKFCYRSWNKDDVVAFRQFIDTFHKHVFNVTNKVVGDMLHHGVTYQFKGVRDEEC